jgi:hypothetical protein
MILSTENLMIFAIAVRVEPGACYDTLYKFSYQVGSLGKEKNFAWVKEEDIVEKNHVNT